MSERPMRRGGAGISAIAGGVTIIACSLGARRPWPEVLPAVLIGCSLVCLGWSVVRRERRR